MVRTWEGCQVITQGPLLRSFLFCSLSLLITFKWNTFLPTTPAPPTDEAIEVPVAVGDNRKVDTEHASVKCGEKHSKSSGAWHHFTDVMVG